MTDLETGVAPAPDVADPADPPGLRLAALHDYLRAHLSGVDPDRPPVPRLLTGGRSNVTYRLDSGDRSWVLRRPPLGHVMPTAHDMGREFRVLRGLADLAVPAPRPHLFCADPAVIGAPFLVMDFVDGEILASAQDTADLPEGRAEEVGDALVDTLADLHAADVSGTALAGLGRPHGYLTRQAALWRTQWERTRERDVPGLDRLAAVVAERVPAFADRPWSLVHGDYRLDNLILAPGRPEVRAVLDWEMATLGDPVCDLALLLVYWTEAGDRLRRDVPVARDVTSVPGFPDRAGVLARYRARRPVDDDHLETCLALVCLKLAVVMESIHVRHRMGQGLAADQAEMASAAPALVELGLRVTDGDGIGALAA